MEWSCLRAVIIEDEKPSLELMQRMIEKNGLLELVGAYTNPGKALDDIPRISPDVVFADVEMPTLNGIELARKVRELDANIQIVFVTAYEKYAVEAFRVHAVNYILKPVTKEDLSNTINRLMEGYHRRQFPSAAENRRRILALGDLAVYGANKDQPVRWPTEKVRELLSCFILSGGEPLEKWRLCERVWPQSAPKRAEHSLHSAVNMMRNALGEAGISDPLSCQKSRYRMDLSGFSCDAWEMQTFIVNHPMVSDENIVRYEEALALYRGDLFGTADYAWCIESRENLRSLYLSGMKNVGRYFFEKKNYGRAEEFLQRLARSDPYDEEAAALLFTIYFFAGSKEKMAGCYARLKTALNDDLGIAPKAETARLYADLLGKL